VNTWAVDDLIVVETSGPCIHQLDELLKANKVKRQAYH
jgi:hypothetical protein